MIKEHTMIALLIIPGFLIFWALMLIFAPDGITIKDGKIVKN